MQQISACVLPLQCIKKKKSWLRMMSQMEKRAVMKGLKTWISSRQAESDEDGEFEANMKAPARLIHCIPAVLVKAILAATA